MLSRLWWKEFRVFAPLMVAVGLMALLMQWALLRSGTPLFHAGILTPIALGWASLFACAVGATAFAGERETGTLALLDTLIVERRTLWLGKVTFGVLSSLALALVLLATAALGTQQRDETIYPLGRIIAGFGSLILETLAWSLFFSSFAGNALIAAVLGMATVGVVAMLITGEPGLIDDVLLAQTAPWRLALAAAAMVVSRYQIVSRHRPKRPRAPRVPTLVETSVGAQRSRGSRMTRYLSSTARIQVLDLQSRAIRSLVWKTIREARWTLLLIYGFALLLSEFVLSHVIQWYDRMTIALPFGVVLGVVAGVSVFGGESPERTFRFYVHHGVRPRLLWTVKVFVWTVGLLATVILGGLSLWFLNVAWAHSVESTLMAILAFFEAFAIAQLCGMLIRRGITAGVVSLLLLFLIMMPQVGLVRANMIPEWGLILTPALALLMSFVWVGEWMFDRPGLGRSIRLTLLLTVPVVLQGGLYVAFRAYDIPDIGPAYNLAQVEPLKIPDGQNAAKVYGQAIDKLVFRSYDIPNPGPVIPAAEFDANRPRNEPQRWRAGGRQSASFEARSDGLLQQRENLGIPWWRENQEALELVRTAAAMPEASFSRESISGDGDPVVAKMMTLAHLVALDRDQRLPKKEFAAAWDANRVLFHMADQLSRPPATIWHWLVADNIETIAIDGAFSWVAEPGQTAAHLRTALTDLQRLPLMRSPELALTVDLYLLEQDLNLPTEELIDRFHQGSRKDQVPWMQVLENLVLYTPWERERAKRVLRQIAPEARGQVSDGRLLDARFGLRSAVMYEGRGSPGSYQGVSIPETQLLSTSMLARMIAPNFFGPYRNYQYLASRARELELSLALRVWQLEHNGTFPTALEELVPSVLAGIPLDPFTGRPFLYLLVGEELAAQLNSGEASPLITEGTREEISPGDALLYRTGIDQTSKLKLYFDDNTALHHLSKAGRGPDPASPL
ncbi:ABC transporter permease [Singulisphaera rosea]